MSMIGRQRWMRHGALLLFLFVFGWAGGVGTLLPWNQTCRICDGDGIWEQKADPHAAFIPPFFPDESPDNCGACQGTGVREAGRAQLNYLLMRMIRTAWLFACLGTAVFLIWSLRLANCRLCRGAGRLQLEAIPPGEPGFTVDAECSACDGKGRLPLLDRWVLWRGWR